MKRDQNENDIKGNGGRDQPNEKDVGQESFGRRDEPLFKKGQVACDHGIKECIDDQKNEKINFKPFECGDEKKVSPCEKGGETVCHCNHQRKKT